jgi:hypothetical protein
MTATRLRERPIGELLGRFASETSTLIGYEMELARAEIGEQTQKAKAGAGMFGAAAALGLAGLGALTACAIAALAEVMDTWLAALIVGVALLAIAGALALAGKSRVKAISAPVPERTVDSMRSDLGAVQSGLQAGRHDNGGGMTNGA